jgi:hypothetical protein
MYLGNISVKKLKNMNNHAKDVETRIVVEANFFEEIVRP